jgi:SAM-dependent methyltransferase
MSSAIRPGPKTKRFLIVPAGGSGEGMGHLARCVGLARQLKRSRGYRTNVAFLASRLDTASLDHLRRSMNRRCEILHELGPGRRWDLIVLDNRSTTLSELRHLQASGPVVCLDEGGEARPQASFLIDSLPHISGSSPANLSSLSFLELPRRARRTVRWPPRKVLVSFGGEDRENLSGRLLDALLSGSFFSPSQITVVEGPLFSARAWPTGVTVMSGVNRLADLLSTYDVVFTHFGLTALEALASGVPVILLNPGPYHARLGRASGIPQIGIKSPDLKALERLLSDGDQARGRVDAFVKLAGPRGAGRLASLLHSMRPHGTARCPVCGREGNSVLARFPDRTYRTCGGCGVMYLESFAEKNIAYGSRYFAAEYKAHYGRTYLEDFEGIKAASRERLRILRRCAEAELEGAIVDVGCAYGPFLSAARDGGLPCFGVDVSQQAVDYVTKKLRIPAACSSFEDIRRRDLPPRISAFTFWYVIEHFPDVDLVLRKVSALLPVGGVLAFSTPNGKGISARKNLRLFLDASPPDHFAVFSPVRLEKILASYGFELRRVRVTGHHPERFPGLAGKVAHGSRAARRMLACASRILGLGDTFEAYAVKVNLP